MVFAAWLIALIVCVPAILQIQHVVVYSETAFNPKDSESSRAQQIVSSEFSISEGSSGVVVLSAKDVRMNETRDFVLALNWTLHNDPRLSNVNNVTSLYGIYYQLLLGYVSVSHFQLYQVDNATRLALFLEYGLPFSYVTAWEGLLGSGDFDLKGSEVALLNRQANSTSWAFVSTQVPPAYQSIALAYQNLFYTSWNKTFSPSKSYTSFQLLLQEPPLLRAQNVTRGYPGLAVQPPNYNVTYAYFQSLALDPQTRSIFLSTARSFNMFPLCSVCTNWNDPASIRSFTISTYATLSGTTPSQLPLLGQVYDLGPSPLASLSSVLAKRLVATGNVLTYPVQPSRAVYSQFVSNSNDTMLVIVDFRNQGPDPRNSIPDIRDDLALANVVSGQNLTAYVTGAPAFNYDIENESVTDIETIDPVTIALIIIIIGLFFGSVTAPFLPVSAIGLSVGAALGLIYLVGSFITPIHFLVLTLLPVSMFGAGSDYCIFLVSRYAEERRNGRPKEEAVEQAVTWAGESIVTSGATVMIAFGSLAVASFGMLRSVGIAVLIGISMALLVSLTLVPAALTMFGDRIFWPRGIRIGERKNAKNGYYSRAAKFTGRHSKLILIMALAISVPATATVFSSHVSHDLISQIPDNLGSKAGYNAMVQGFGPGVATPTYTIVQTPVLLATATWINITAFTALSTLENSTLSLKGVSKVYGPLRPSGETIPYYAFNRLDPAQQQFMIRSMKPFLGEDGKSAIIFSVLSNEPYSDASIETVARIKSEVINVGSQNPLLASSTILVGGETASIADLSESSSSDYFNLSALVLGGVFLVLMLALGSVFTPLRLIFTILLSISWAMALVLVFSLTFLGSDLIWLLPIMLLVVMVGLGLDYDIFLITRVREYVTQGASDDAAIESAVEHTGGIITACGLVMAGAFATMMLSRIPLLDQLGFGIFTVVLLDAGIVRIYLVPSIMRLMKNLNWWAPWPLRRVHRPIGSLPDKILRESSETAKDTC